MAQYLQFFHNHPALFAALGVLLLLYVANEVWGHISRGPSVSPLEAIRMMNDRDALVVDVRGQADFKKSHVLNAINVPLPKFDERSADFGKDKARPIVVYCSLGGSSSEAARKLGSLGYTEVYAMRGGLERWIAASLPVTAK